MKTNLEKKAYYEGILNSKIEEFLKQGEPYPTAFYEIYPNGKFIERQILKVIYYDREFILSSFNKKPTKKDINRLIEIVDTIVFKKENIRFKYDAYNSKGAKEIKESKKFTFDKEEAESISKEINDRIEHENHLLKNNHTRCERCRRVVPDDKIVTTKITSIPTYGRAGRIANFCSGTCASHEQYAHEG